MDEYEIGEVVKLPDGNRYRFKGGDKSKLASWELAEMLPQERAYMPAFARDAPTYTPEQARGAASLAIGAGSMAIPGLGPLGNIAAGGAVGAAMGAVGAEPGHRVEAAKTGGVLGLLGGATAEAGMGLIGALKRPKGILALKEMVPNVRTKITEAGTQAAQFFRDEEGKIVDLFKRRGKQVDEMTDAMAADVAAQTEAQIARKNAEADDAISGITRETEAESAAQQAGMGARVAGETRRIAGVPENIDDAMAQARLGKEQVREMFYQDFDARFPEIKHKPLIDFLKTPELQGATRSIAPDVLKGKGLSFKQAQDIRNRFASGRFRDPAIRDRMTQLLSEAGLGDDLATADAAYAGFSQWQRGALEGQSAGAWPASKIRDWHATHTSPQAQMGFREGRLADLTQKIQQRNEGTPYLQKLMDGGPEMDERLRTIFPDDESFNAVKAVIREERDRLAQITARREDVVSAATGRRNAASQGLLARRDRTVERLDTRRRGLMEDIAKQEAGARDALGAAKAAETNRLGLLDQRAVELEAQRKALEESARRTARRIKAIGIGSALAAMSYRYGALRSAQEAVAP